MAEYIDREALLELINEDCKYQNPTNEYTRGCNEVCDWAIKTIKNIPTADVVPKSEYDAVVSAVDNSTKEFLKLHDAYQNQKAETEKWKAEAEECYSDTAIMREYTINQIFEEIDALFVRFYDDPSYSSGELGYDIAELKKKYTKENTENENQN